VVWLVTVVLATVGLVPVVVGAPEVVVGEAAVVVVGRAPVDVTGLLISVAIVFEIVVVGDISEIRWQCHQIWDDTPRPTIAREATHTAANVFQHVIHLMQEIISLIAYRILKLTFRSCD